MMFQAVEGVSFLHSKGVVHADVKSVSHHHACSRLYAVHPSCKVLASHAFDATALSSAAYMLLLPLSSPVLFHTLLMPLSSPVLLHIAQSYYCIWHHSSKLTAVQRGMQFT